MIYVLMSTYNGEHFLRQQLDSILQQEGVEVHILVRDDGSTDQTLAILAEYRATGKLDYYSGQNLRSARSFMQLLYDAPEADYYAFCDQDDYWVPDKLKVAVDSIKDVGAEQPALYFCQTRLADATLQPLPSVIISPRLTFGEALMYKFIGGCTMVMSRGLVCKMREYHPAYLPMHDVWVYLVAQAIGARIVFDKTPHILYRQHGNNVLGQGDKLVEWKRKFQRFIHPDDAFANLRYRMAVELHKGYGAQLPRENSALLQRFLAGKTSLRTRLSMIADARFRCPVRLTNMLFWLSLLDNKY